MILIITLTCQRVLKLFLISEIISDFPSGITQYMINTVCDVVVTLLGIRKGWCVSEGEY